MDNDNAAKDALLDIHVGKHCWATFGEIPDLPPPESPFWGNGSEDTSGYVKQMAQAQKEFGRGLAMWIRSRSQFSDPEDIEYEAMMIAGMLGIVMFFKHQPHYKRLHQLLTQNAR